VTSQNANNYSLAQVQVNKLQTFSIQQMGIYATVLQCDSVQCNYTECVTKGVLFLQVAFRVHTAISSIILTTRVNYSSSIVLGDKIH